MDTPGPPSTPPVGGRGDGRSTGPTLLIWDTQDRFLDPEMARSSIALCDQGRLELIPEATHWVQLEEPERVNRLLVEFLT